MNTDVKVDEFLEHFGKSGMHWGQRSAGQKAKITVAGLAIGGAAANIILSRTLNTKLSTIGGVAALAGGAILAGKLLDRHGKKKAKEVNKYQALADSNAKPKVELA